MNDRKPYLVDRLQEFGITIFAEMSALAERTGAINLGQGFPDSDGPDEVLEAAIAATRRAVAYCRCAGRWPTTSDGSTASRWTPRPRCS